MLKYNSNREIIHKLAVNSYMMEGWVKTELTHAVNPKFDPDKINMT